MSTTITAEHADAHSITELVIYEDHAVRTDSPEFVRNKRQLVRKLGLGCWVCGCKDNPEVHHIHEWALWPALDPAKVLDTLHVFDPYGFTHQLGEKPITSPDDIRNLLVLCGQCVIDGTVVPGGHHRGVNAGVHEETLPTWIAQRAVKQGHSITKALVQIKKINAAKSAAIKEASP